MAVLNFVNISIQLGHTAVLMDGWDPEEMLRVVEFFFSSRSRHTRCSRDWSSDVCSSDLVSGGPNALQLEVQHTLGAAASTGEWALTSGVGGGYPRGLVVGEIASVTRHDSATTEDRKSVV